MNKKGMTKKEEFRERRRRAAARQRAIIIGGVVVVAGLFGFLLAWPSIRPASPVVVTVVPSPANRPPTKGTSMGDPNAPAKLDIWEDFQCSGCLHFSLNEEPQIIQQMVATGKVYYTFHFYPFIDGGKGESQDSANAAMCASEQGRFWDYHDMLFANWLGENAGSFTPARLVAFAKNIGLDMTAFNSCFQANKYAATILQDYQAGKKQGVQATPGIFVNGKVLEGKAGQFALPTVDEVLQALAAASGG